MIIVMSLKTAIRAFLLNILGAEPKKAETAANPIKPAEKGGLISEIVSIWDLIDFKESTQAFHLSQVIGFDEWIDMEEIRRRIAEVFGIQYKNERSLYPHLKTLCDLGFFETTDVGGKRKWRKRDLLVNLTERSKKKRQAAKEQEEATAQVSATNNKT